jgi:hypothetical protein
MPQSNDEPSTAKSRGDSNRPRRREWVKALGIAATFVLAGTIVSACGGGSPGVASVGSTTTSTTTASASSGGGVGKAGGGVNIVSYSQCMQHHGLPNFPLPQKTANGYSIQISPADGVDPGSAKFKSAQTACQHFLPNKGVGPTITPADQADYLKATACMRTHGYPAFPDPAITKTSVHYTVPSNINQGSTQFKNAVATCEKLIPNDLPYSPGN